MWWLFEILSETEQEVLYAYSRANRLLDGRVTINKKNGNIKLLAPCADDSESKFAQDKAIEKSYVMIRKGYPKHYQVACG